MENPKVYDSYMLSTLVPQDYVRKILLDKIVYLNSPVPVQEIMFVPNNW